MSVDWKAKSYSSNSTPISVDEDLLDEEAVILLQGKNIFDDTIFSYIKMTLRNMQAMHESLRKGEKFMPAEYGTVLAAGKGEPSQELKSEMAVTYKMLDVPAVNTAPQPEKAKQKPKLGSFTSKIQYSPED